MLKGITVTLYERLQTGTDSLGAPVYTETPVSVENVLVAPQTVTNGPTSTDLENKKAIYQLAIPKGDAHDWLDSRIEFFGQTWKSFGFYQAGIEDLIPGPWHKKVMVEQYGS